MILTFLKRQCQLWGYTATGFLLLLGAGFVIGLWNDSSLIEYARSNTESLSFAWWRACVYGLLLVFWPGISGWLTPNRQSVGSRFPSRFPLIVVIILYELLIVQNPLALLLKLAS